MRMSHTVGMLALSFAVVLAGCATPPEAEVAATRSSLATAESEGASDYAPQSWQAAQKAVSALEAELHMQEQNWVKSYDQAKGLAIAAKEAGHAASKEAMTARTAKEVAMAARARAAAAAKAELARVKASAVRVGGGVQAPVKIKNVTPVYPEIARSARVSGTVQVEATIDANGKVAEARVVKSVPLLDEAALDAVRQWEYRPGLVNGNPAPVVVTVTVNFER